MLCVVLCGQPVELIDALIRQGAKDLTIVSNNAGNGDTGLAALLAAGRVRKVVCSFPRQVDSWVFDGLYRAGEIELEVVPQGNLAERIRAAGAGIGAFFSPTGVGTQLAEGGLLSAGTIEIFLIRGLMSPFAHVMFTAFIGVALGFGDQPGVVEDAEHEVAPRLRPLGVSARVVRASLADFLR